MVIDLTLQKLYNLVASEITSDDLATHLLLACPATHSWGLVSLRSPLSISLAIATPGILPVAHLATIERHYFSKVTNFAALETALLDLIGARDFDSDLISFLEAFNVMENNASGGNESDGLP